MKKIKSIILISVILIILVIILIILLKINEINREEYRIEQEIEKIEEAKVEKLTKEDNINSYILFNEVINNMFNYISEKEKSVLNSKAVLSILDSKYIEENKLNEKNVLNFLSEYKNISSYSTKEIYIRDINQRQNTNGRLLYLKGIYRKDGLEEWIYLLVRQDLQNSAYSIEILNENEFNNILEDTNIEINITKNDYNNIYAKNITDYQICLEYFNDYINTIKNNPSKGYDLLEIEYKNKRFKTQEEYIKYVNSMKNKNATSVLKEYSIEEDNGITKYVCLDTKGNYYIFIKQEMMNYTLMLDTYTIELPEFIEKYNNANSLEKAGYNIQKCIEAINNKDYLYVYSKLNNEFKENKFKTEQSLINTINNNLFESNKVSDVSTNNEGYIYIYNITIEDLENKNNKRDMTIIMKLKEGTDFEMSFSFE